MATSEWCGLKIASVAMLLAIMTVTAAGQSRPGADPRKNIATALSAAKKDGKPVLLDFGSPGCVDCEVLWKLLKDPAVAEYQKQHFHLVEIDIGVYFMTPDSDRAKNRDISSEYGVDPTEGVPALILLSPEGKVIPSDHQIKWRTARTFSAEDVLRYLQQLITKTPARP